VRKISGAKIKLIVGLVLIVSELLAQATADSGIDLHWLWRDRCISCHGNSAEFARKFLSISGSKLRGRHHVDDLHLFLHNHYLTGQVVDEVYAMLFAQVSYPPRFKDECSACHQNAASFVREKLLFQDGVLNIRKTGRGVKGFLENHRRLNDEDVIFFAELLIRVAKEVNLPNN